MRESRTTSDIAIAIFEKKSNTEASSALLNVSIDIAPIEII